MSEYSGISDRSITKEIFVISEQFPRLVIERILTFLSVSSLFIGGHGFFKTFIGFMLLGMNPSIQVCLIVFLVTFCVYSLDKVVDMDKDLTNMPERRNFLYERRKLVLAYSIAAYILAILLILLDKPWGLPIVFLPFIANAFYGSKPFKSLPRLKEIPLVKNLVVAGTWALVTTLLPALHLANPFTAGVALVVYFMLIKTFVDNILYDVRDVAGDRENGIKTMASLLGERKTLVILLAANSTLIPWLLLAPEAIRPLALALTIYGYAYIIYFSKKRNPLALDFFVEGEWMLITMGMLALRGLGVMA
jgi:4-hydroxybenzoate polyprenyltransferase